MSAASFYLREFLALDMAFSPPSTAESRDNSPEPVKRPQRDMDEVERSQSSALLKLPADIFKCVTDYLTRDDAWFLKLVCRGLSRSKHVNEVFYRYPIQLRDVREMRLSDWKYKDGLRRWTNFQKSIDDSNRHYVQKLAMSHWCSIADFKWIEENLPKLNSLDLSSIKDFVYTPDETWTWKMLADACPKLLARVEELEVANWADYAAHTRVDYTYAYGDYKYKSRFRLSRRRDGGSVAKMIFPLCTRLRSLGIRERYAGFHAWNEYECHQRVCCLVDGVDKNCADTLQTLRIHDVAPYRSLFAADIPRWSKLSKIEIGIYTWVEDRGDRDYHNPYRMTAGDHHREEEEAFDDQTYASCERDHMQLGSAVVSGSSSSFETLFKDVHNLRQKYPNVKLRPIESPRLNTKPNLLHPFCLINVYHRRPIWAPPMVPAGQPQEPPRDPMASPEVQDTLRWLSADCGWKPLIAYDPLMCDVFPDNVETPQTILPKEEILFRLLNMFATLRTLGVPVRLSIGEKLNSSPSSAYDGAFFFGDYKQLVGEGDARKEILAPTQARFNLASMAPLVDELTIQYPYGIAGTALGLGSRHREPTDAEKELFARELRGWRIFWTRYARQFKNLKKLTTFIPNQIYAEWGTCADLGELLSSSDWQMLETDTRQYSPFTALDSFWPWSLRYNTGRRRGKNRFVQRVFFRQSTEELPLGEPRFTEDMEITEGAAAAGDAFEHRFWPPEKEDEMQQTRKRKAEGADGVEEGESGTKKTRTL